MFPFSHFSIVESSQIRVKNLSTLNFGRCLVESINIVMFLVFGIARNRYSGYDIIFALIDDDGFRVLHTASRFGFLKIAFRNRSQFLGAPTPTKPGKNAVLDIQLSVKVLSSRAEASFHEGLLKVVAVVVGNEEKKGRKGKSE
jgi:hypothetical protein